MAITDPEQIGPLNPFERHEPLCRHLRGKTWKKIDFLQEKLTLRGGFAHNNEEFVIPSVEHVCPLPDTRSRLFVEVCKNTPWLLQMVGGSQMRKGDLADVKVLDELEARIIAAQDKQEADPDEVPDGPSNCIRPGGSVGDCLGPIRGCGKP